MENTATRTTPTTDTTTATIWGEGEKRGEGERESIYLLVSRFLKKTIHLCWHKEQQKRDSQWYMCIYTLITVTLSMRRMMEKRKTHTQAAW